MGRGGARITSKRTHLQGGGTNSGRMPTAETPGVTREQIQADRLKTTSMTLGDALAERAAALKPAEIPSFVENLQAAMAEAQRGDSRALNSYALAMSKLAVKEPLQWRAIQSASGMEPQSFAAALDTTKMNFGEADPNFVGPTRPEITPDDALAMQGDFMADPTAMLDERIGGELSAQAMPVSPPVMTRANVPWSWADFLGGAEAAKSARFREGRWDDTKQLFPQLASAEAIRILAKESGLPFTPVSGPQVAGRIDPAAKAAMDLIENEAKFNFEQKRGLRDQYTQEIAPEVMADPNIPDGAFSFGSDPSDRIEYTQRDLALARRVQDRLDATNVANYPEDLGDRIRALMAERLTQEQAVPLAASPAPSFDPIARQAELDAAAEQLPEEYLDPDFVGPLLPPPEVSVPDVGGNPDAPPVWEDPTVAMGGDALRMGDNLQRMNFNIRIPAGGSNKITQERNFLNASRSPLDKALEENQMIMEGRGSLPDNLVKLLTAPDADPELRALVYANQKALYDLDNRFPNHRLGVRMRNPMTGEVIVVPYPPDVLAGLAAQSMDITDLNTIDRMVGPMQNSMDIYNRLPPTGEAKKLLASLAEQADEPPTTSLFEPLKERHGLDKARLELREQRRRQLMQSLEEDAKRRAGMPPAKLYRHKPPQAPPTPDMTDTSMMPMSDRFASGRVNPLYALMG